MENKFLTVGYITSTRGLKGVLRVKSTSYFAKERYKKGNLVYLYNEKDNTRISVIANTYSTDNKFDYVSFKDLEDINLVEKYIGYGRAAVVRIRFALTQSELILRLKQQVDDLALGGLKQFIGVTAVPLKLPAVLPEILGRAGTAHKKAAEIGQNIAVWVDCFGDKPIVALRIGRPSVCIRLVAAAPEAACRAVAAGYARLRPIRRDILIAACAQHQHQTYSAAGSDA